MKVDISSIRYSEGSSLEVSLSQEFEPFEWADEELRFQQPVRAELQFTNTGKLILAEGHIEITLAVACSRCLEPFDLVLQLPFCIGYQEDLEQGEDSEAEDEEIEIRKFKEKVIDITPDVKETILLSLPMKFLCHDNCRGLCSQCGQNLNEKACNCEQDYIDPRLAALRDFID